VLGAPVGVYEDDKYPFLRDELDLLTVRLKTGQPTLGICLGSQLIACALGAKVYPSGVKEIGWAPIELTDAAVSTPLRHLVNTAVLHWHGDTFDLPPGAVHLASTTICRNQAFCLGPNILGLQFHPEADPNAGIEAWLVGHAAELAAARIDPRALRSGATAAGLSLLTKARDMFTECCGHDGRARGSRMTVISIQSQVVHGHVGNSAAVFPLQARGIEVAVVPTTLLSNHLP
jgi:GMP synthase (glutamine-hydrolysing)